MEDQDIRKIVLAERIIIALTNEGGTKIFACRATEFLTVISSIKSRLKNSCIQLEFINTYPNLNLNFPYGCFSEFPSLKKVILCGKFNNPRETFGQNISIEYRDVAVQLIAQDNRRYIFYPRVGSSFQSDMEIDQAYKSCKSLLILNCGHEDIDLDCFCQNGWHFETFVLYGKANIPEAAYEKLGLKNCYISSGNDCYHIVSKCFNSLRYIVLDHDSRRLQDINSIIQIQNRAIKPKLMVKFEPTPQCVFVKLSIDLRKDYVKEFMETDLEQFKNWVCGLANNIQPERLMLTLYSHNVSAAESFKANIPSNIPKQNVIIKNDCDIELVEFARLKSLPIEINSSQRLLDEQNNQIHKFNETPQKPILHNTTQNQKANIQQPSIQTDKDIYDFAKFYYINVFAPKHRNESLNLANSKSIKELMKTPEFKAWSKEHNLGGVDKVGKINLVPKERDLDL